MHTIKLQVHDSIYSHIMFLLKSLSTKELQIIEDKTISSDHSDHHVDLRSFSNHSANLIDDWKDAREDEIWK